MKNLALKTFTTLCFTSLLIFSACGVAEDPHDIENAEVHFMDWGSDYTHVHAEMMSNPIFNDADKRYFAEVEILKLESLLDDFINADYNDIVHFDFPFRHYGVAKKNRVILTSEMIRAIQLGLIKYGTGGVLDVENKGLFVLVLTSLFSRLPDAEELIDYLNNVTVHRPFAKIADEHKVWNGSFRRNYDIVRERAIKQGRPRLMVNFLELESVELNKISKKIAKAKKSRRKKIRICQWQENHTQGTYKSRGCQFSRD